MADIKNQIKKGLADAITDKVAGKTGLDEKTVGRSLTR